MRVDEITERLVDQALALRQEVSLLSRLFERSGFLGDVNNLPHAHYGYLMATLGQIDTLSRCNDGAEPSQTKQMVCFLENYVHSGKGDMHRVVVQMLRHTPMHTGALRYFYDLDDKTAYTWRVYFGDLPVGVTHYTVTQLDPTCQDDVLETARLAGLAAPTSITALNISLTALTEDLVRGAKNFVNVMLADRTKRDNTENVYRKIQMQTIDPRRGSSARRRRQLRDDPKMLP